MWGLVNFVQEIKSPRIIFGHGSLEKLFDEITNLNCKSVALVCDESARNIAQDLATQLDYLVKLKVDHVVMHVPDEFTSPIIEQATSLGVDLVVAVGGGSATGLGKILALEVGIPLLAIPTTYAGSEMTPIWGRTKENIKLTGSDPKVKPIVAIYEPKLTYSLPLVISVNSAMNAIAHAVESLYAPDMSPLVEAAALKGIEIMSAGMRNLVKMNKISLREKRCFSVRCCVVTL